MLNITILDKLGTPLETHSFKGSVNSFFRSIDGFSEYSRLSLTIESDIRGRLSVLDDVVCDENITITVEPNGDPVTWILIIITALSAAYSYYVSSNLPKGYESTAESGKSIYSPNANANSAVPNGFIRELAGKMTCYPDLICQPHRRYDDNDEYLYLALGVTAGHISMLDKNIYIAETKMSSYENDIEINIVEPGMSNVGIVALENWYQSKEVAGLRLITKSTPKTGAWTADYAASTITTYLDGVAEPFPFIAGERFEILTGSNVGYYDVVSISGADNEIATVRRLKRAGGDTGRLEVVSQRVSTGSVDNEGRTHSVTRNVFDVTGDDIGTVVLAEAVTFESIAGGINWEGPFQVVPRNEKARYAGVDIFFPQGLYKLNSENDIDETTVEIEVQWRDYGTELWNTVVGTTYTFATYDQTGITLDIDFGAEITPEFRVRRVTIDSDEISKVNLVDVARIKCKLNSPSSYPITTVGLKILGTNSLARTAENKVNIRGATRKLPTIDELRSNSWDLYDSATKLDVTHSLYAVEFSSSYQITNNGDYGDQTSTHTTMAWNDSGTVVCAGQNNQMLFYSVYAPFDFNTRTYRGRVPISNPVDDSFCKHVTGDYWIFYGKTKSPFLEPVLHVKNISFPAAGDLVVNSSDLFSYPISGPDIQGYQLSKDGLTAFVVEERILKAYPLSTAYLISTKSAVSTSEYDFNADSVNIVAMDLVFTDVAMPSKVIVLAPGTIYEYSFSTPGDAATITFENRTYTPSILARSVQMFENKLFTSSTNTLIGFMNSYTLDTSVDTRASRSACRFIGYMIRNDLGDSADDVVNWDTLEALDTLLDSRADYLDAEFVDETTLFEAIKIMLTPGYADPTIKNGLFSPTRYDVNDQSVHVYTPDVMIGDGLQVERKHSEEENDGVDVEYFSLETNAVEVVECRIDGDLGFNSKRMQATGIADLTRAWRLGMRERLRIRNKPAVYSFTTELDGLNSEYGETISICSGMFGGEFGSVVDYSGSIVTLDFSPSITAGYAIFRNREGESGLYSITVSGREVTLVSPSTLDFVPVLDYSMDATLCAVGDSSSVSKLAVVKSIEPNGDSVDITAEERVPAIYAYDDQEPS